MFGAIAAGVFGLFILSVIENENEKQRRHEREMMELSYQNERREEEALDSFNIKKDELLSFFTSQLTNDFANNFNFCKKEMEDQYNNFNLELDNIIDKITSIENSENIFISRLNESMEKLSIKMGHLEVKHLNILLVGPSGVGKSFLINTILKENVAETQLTKPSTKSFNIYESIHNPNLRLIDSRGIEKGNYNVDAVIKEITNYIEKRELTGNPDNFVHCIWYCVTGTRFEDIEEETLSKLSSLYDDSKLPVIVVYSQAMVPDYYNSIEENVKKIKNDVEFIPVIAQDIKLSDGSYIKSKNIDLLISMSINKAKNAVSSSVFSAFRKIIKNDTDSQIENSLNAIKVNLNEYISFNGNALSIFKFDEEYNFNEIFKNILYGESSIKDLKKETKEAIIELINELKEKNNKIMETCVNDFVHKISYELAGKLMELQTEVNQENRGYLKQYKTLKNFSEEVSSIIFDSISLITKNIGYVNYIKLLPLKLVNLLSKQVKNKFTSIIGANSPENILNKKIQEQFKNVLSIFKK